MVLWSIVPEEQIFATQNNLDNQTLENKLSQEKINYAGCQVLAQAVTENEYCIVRLITTNPSDYLNKKLQPGKLIYCKKNFEELSD